MTSFVDKVIVNCVDSSNPKVFPFQADLAGHDPAGGRVCQCLGLIPDCAHGTILFCASDIIRANHSYLRGHPLTSRVSASNGKLCDQAQRPGIPFPWTIQI